MIARAPVAHRTRAIAGVAGLTALLAVSALPPAGGLAATDAQLTATLELPQGDIDFPLEAGTVHFFDEEGCALPGAGHRRLRGQRPLLGLRRRAGRRCRAPDRLRRALRSQPSHGAAGLRARWAPSARSWNQRPWPSAARAPRAGSRRSAASPPTPRSRRAARMTRTASCCSPRGARTATGPSSATARSGTASSARSPSPSSTTAGSGIELHLLAEGRTPRQVEGVLFSGAQGMLPGQASLEKALGGHHQGTRPARLRGRQGLDRPAAAHRRPGPDGRRLRLPRQPRVRARLARTPTSPQAGWIDEGGAPLEPPQLVAERFTVDLVSADGVQHAAAADRPLAGQPPARAALGVRVGHGQGPDRSTAAT